MNTSSASCLLTRLTIALDATYDLTDDTDHRVAGIKIELVCDSVQQMMGRVDTVLAGMSNSLFPSISGHVSTVASRAQDGFNGIQDLGSCILPLGQALDAAAKLIHTLSDVCDIYLYSCRNPDSCFRW